MAKALGICVFTMPIVGLGRSAWTQSRSIIACSSGASWGLTFCTPIEASAILSEAKSWKRKSPPATTKIVTPDAPLAKRAAISTTYSAPSRNTVISIRAWRPPSARSATFV